MRPAFLAGLGNPGPHPITEDVPLELGEDGQHACQGPATGGRQVEGFVEGDESHVDCGQIVQGRDEVRDRTAPTVEPPDDDGIDVATFGCIDDPLAFGPIIGP